jgi:putative ABC transport system substrate-binding protein
VYALNPQITLKRLEIAQELLVGATRFLVFSDIYTQDQLTSFENAAASRRVQLTVAKFAERPYKYGEAFVKGRQAGVQALLMLTSPVFADDRATVVAEAMNHRLPVVGFTMPEGEFLVGFSADTRKLAQRVAEIGVKILRGAKAGDIPVQQADEFDFVINMRAARTLGIKVPYSLLARATRVIE